jgi:hypothetical protein
VPKGSVLVFPLINGQSPDPVVSPPVPSNEAVDRGIVHSFFDAPSDFTAKVEVDGTLVSTIESAEQNTDFRRESPTGGFSYSIPQNSLHDLILGYDVPEQTVPLAVSDGYWFAYDTKALGPGSHTLAFNASLDLDGDGKSDLTLNVKYKLLNPIEGANKNDHLCGTKTDDYITGGNGDDTVFGKGGDDVIVGGNGKDLISGGRGDDELWGNNGKDTFVYAKDYGTDTIFDFQDRLDKIDVSAFGFGNSGPNFSDVDISNDSTIFALRGITEVAKIDFSDITGNKDDIILLPNIDDKRITAADFIFQ